MFGYVRPCRPELKLRQDAFFRSYYCGVCRTLGKRSGPLCRALLRYDLAFLALVRDGVNDDSSLSKLRCPIKGTKLNLMQGGSIDFAADAHLLLTGAKIRDDRADGRKLMAIPGALLSPAVKKAARLHPELSAALDKMMDAQQKLEADGCDDPDEAAEPFAQFLATLFSIDMPEEAKPALRYMGYNIGKWITWLDALDDFDKDEKKGAYNLWRSAGFDRKKACEWALPLLAECVRQAQLSADLLDARKTNELIDNILTEGMPRVMDAVAEGRRLDDGSL